MAELEPYEIYAIKYADHFRLASANFIGGDPHDGPMPLDYFVWAIKGAARTWIVDTGFDAEVGRQRERNVIRSPAEGLKALDIEPDEIEDVIITHMHYDHCGNHHLFANARFHLQDKEMLYVTGRSHVPRRRCATRSTWRTSWRWCAAPTAAESLSTTATTSSRPASACTSSAATRWAYRWCGCGRSAAGSSSPPMRATSTRTWSKNGRSRSSTTSPTCSPATRERTRSQLRGAT